MNLVNMNLSSLINRISSILDKGSKGGECCDKPLIFTLHFDKKGGKFDVIIVFLFSFLFARAGDKKCHL